MRLIGTMIFVTTMAAGAHAADLADCHAAKEAAQITLGVMEADYGLADGHLNSLNNRALAVEEWYWEHSLGEGEGGVDGAWGPEDEEDILGWFDYAEQHFHSAQFFLSEMNMYLTEGYDFLASGDIFMNQGNYAAAISAFESVDLCEADFELNMYGDDSGETYFYDQYDKSHECLDQAEAIMGSTVYYASTVTPVGKQHPLYRWMLAALLVACILTYHYQYNRVR